MIFRIKHVTDIRYAAPVQLARFNIRLKPASWPDQRLLDYQLSVSPHPGLIPTEQGPYVANVSRLFINEHIESLRIESRFTAEVTASPVTSSHHSPPLAEVRRRSWTSDDLSRFGPTAYLFNSQIARIEAEIGAWASPFLGDDQPVLDAGQALMQAIYAQFAYDADATKTETPPIEAFRARRGVCQDFAHIMIIALRANGIAAAYVSGYLRTLPPPGKERLVGCDAMHAWVSIWCGDELGWVGFDPTNNLLASSDHIFVAMGRDYADVAPVDGVFLGRAGQQLRVAVDVLPVE